jgi:hypothetical protein
MSTLSCKISGLVDGNLEMLLLSHVLTKEDRWLMIVLICAVKSCRQAVSDTLRGFCSRKWRFRSLKEASILLELDELDMVRTKLFW